VAAEELALSDDDGFVFRFAVYGDNQRGVPIHRRIAENIARSNATVVLHVGDYVQDGRQEPQWDEQFARPAAELLANTIFLGVQGNHDRNSPRYYDLLRPPGKKPWFRKLVGPVAFFGLDTNLGLKNGSDQLEWLERALARTRRKWKVAFFHEPPYSSSWPWPGGALKTRNTIMPLLEAAGVDLVFTGHIHNYERFHKDGIPYIITGGGGDTLSKPEQLPNPFRRWTAMLHHFCTADVYGDRIEVLARDLTGKPFDGLVVRKGSLTEAEVEERKSYEGPLPQRRPTLGGRNRRRPGKNGAGEAPWGPATGRGNAGG